MSRPSILVTASTYPRWAGDSQTRFVHDLAIRLAARAEVTVIAPGSHGARPHEQLDGVEVHRIRYWRDRPDLLCDGPALPTIRRRPWTVLQVPPYLATHYRAVRRALTSRHFDAIHANWILPQGAIAQLARRGTGTRLVVTAHGADIYGLDPLAPLTGWVLRHADAFTGVSGAVVDRARELGLPPDVETHVAPMGIDTDLFRPDRDARAVRRAELGVRGPLVLFAGRLTEKKGVGVLLDAIAARRRALPHDLQLAIVGSGELESQLRRQVHRLGLGDVVQFHGFRPHTELASWYAAADVFVGPSVVAAGGDSEGFGLVFAEALAAGCPVIASDLAAIRDVVDDRAAGLRVEPGDVAALGDALRDVLAEPERWRDRALADASRVADRFGWEGVVDRYHRILVGGVTR